MGTVVNLPSPRRRRVLVPAKGQATIHLFMGVRYVREPEAERVVVHSVITDPRHIETPFELA